MIEGCSSERGERDAISIKLPALIQNKSSVSISHMILKSELLLNFGPLLLLSLHKTTILHIHSGFRLPSMAGLGGEIGGENTFAYVNTYPLACGMRMRRVQRK